MEAIILAGGLGTRLKELTAETPKPMVSIHGRPFLEYLLDYLVSQGITRVSLAVGYKSNVIKEHFSNSYKNLNIYYSQETEPLGTGGCLKKALASAKTDNVFVLNGDTFFSVDLYELLKHHKQSDCEITLSLKPMNNFDRYGTVQVNNGKIVKFEEKRHQQKGLINGGVYVLKPNIFASYNLSNKFSLEKDFLEPFVNQLNISAYMSDGYFIDIGTVKDYRLSQIEWRNLKR